MTPQAKEILALIIKDGTRLGFGAISTRIANPIPKANYVKAYEELVKKGVIRERDELSQVEALIGSAIILLESDKNEEAKREIEKAIAQTTCKRCARNLLNIDWTNQETALNYLRTVYRLLPSYYTILEEEAQLHTQLTTTQSDSDARTQSEMKADSEVDRVVEEEATCRGCDVSKIVEACEWDQDCLSHIISISEAKVAHNERVSNDELVKEAKEFVKRRSTTR